MDTRADIEHDRAVRECGWCHDHRRFADTCKDCLADVMAADPNIEPHEWLNRHGQDWTNQ
jgi:hypothetical protein